MTAPIYTGYQQSLSYSAVKDRHIVNGPMMRRATANAVSGVIPQGQSGLFAKATGFNVSVENGAALVNSYWFIADGNTTVTVAPTTGTARRDLIIARVYDTMGGDAVSEGKIEVVKGTTVSDPPLPARSLLLWQVDVPASGPSVTLVDRRVWTVAAGAVKPVKDISTLVITDQMQGMPLFDLDTGIHWYRYGSTLKRLGAQVIASGNPYFNGNVETGGPSGAVWQIAQFGPIVLPSPASFVQISGTWTLTALSDARFDMKLAFDNTEILHVVNDSHGSSGGNGDGDRTYTYTATINNRAAGQHDLCWMGIMCGLGGPIHVHNASYSWVAFG